MGIFQYHAISAKLSLSLYIYIYIYIYIYVALGGLVVSVLATGPKLRGFDPDRGRWIFKGDKIPEHHFLRRGSKAVDPMSLIFSGMNRTRSVRKQNSSGHFSLKPPDCLPDGSGSLIRIEQKLVRSVSRSLTTECTLTDHETFGMKSQKKEALAHPGL
jgi:hypothetical protein